VFSTPTDEKWTSFHVDMQTLTLSASPTVEFGLGNWYFGTNSNEPSLYSWRNTPTGAYYGERSDFIITPAAEPPDPEPIAAPSSLALLGVSLPMLGLIAVGRRRATAAQC
jgi:hypothetical protein